MYTTAQMLAGLSLTRGVHSGVKNVLEEAFAVYGKPNIINSDQGSQYTSASRTGYFEQQGISISMDGKGRTLDNVWTSVSGSS